MTTIMSSKNDYEIGKILEIPPDGAITWPRIMKITSKWQLRNGLFLYELEEI